MRKNIKVISVLLCVFVMLFSLSACQEGYFEAKETYEIIESGKAMLKKYKSVTSSKELTIKDEYEGEPVVSIGKFAIACAKYVETIRIGKNIKEIDKWAFTDSDKIRAFVVSEENQYFSSVDGVLFNKDKTELIAYPNGKNKTTEVKQRTSYIVPDNVEIIGENSFYRARNLESVTLPNTIKTINDRAFLRCDSLITLNIPDSVTKLGNDALSYCGKLINIFIPKSVIEIGSFALFATNATDEIYFERESLDGIIQGERWLPDKQKSKKMLKENVLIIFNSVRKVG